MIILTDLVNNNLDRKDRVCRPCFRGATRGRGPLSAAEPTELIKSIGMDWNEGDGRRAGNENGPGSVIPGRPSTGGFPDDHCASAETTSPPLRVTSERRVTMLIVSFRKRTLPSPNRTLAP